MLRFTIAIYSTKYDTSVFKKQFYQTEIYLQLSVTVDIYGEGFYLLGINSSRERRLNYLLVLVQDGS